MLLLGISLSRGFHHCAHSPLPECSGRRVVVAPQPPAAGSHGARNMGSKLREFTRKDKYEPRLGQVHRRLETPTCLPNTSDKTKKIAKTGR